MNIRSLGIVLASTLLIIACKKTEFDIRPEEKILNGSSVRNWEISAIRNSQTGEDLYDSLLSDCQKDNFFAFYSDNKYEYRDNDIMCIVDTSSDVIEEGIWSVTTDDIYFDILSSNTLTHERYEIIEVTTSTLVIEDTSFTRYTLSPL